MAPGLEVIHEASNVMSEMVTSSLVGVEQAFLFLVFSGSGVLTSSRCLIFVTVPETALGCLDPTVLTEVPLCPPGADLVLEDVDGGYLFINRVEGRDLFLMD